ncbi:MAG: hypothetical protein ACP5D1_06205 [Bacteroidales bacterium]
MKCLLKKVLGILILVTFFFSACKKEAIEDPKEKLRKYPGVNLKVDRPGGKESYFITTITNGDTLNGTYPGWCLDTDKHLLSDTLYTVKVVAPDDEILSLFIECPENIDLMTYIINAGYVGQPAYSGGEFTYGDVQLAIWSLIDDNQSHVGLDDWDQDRVNEIIDEALQYGEGYVPIMGGVTPIVFIPYWENDLYTAQISIIEFPLGD